MTDTDAIRARHAPRWEGDIDRTTPAGDPVLRQVCNWRDCENDWPCDTAIVLAALDAFLKDAIDPADFDGAVWTANAAIEREARLRAALEAIVSDDLRPDFEDGNDIVLRWPGNRRDWEAARAALANVGSEGTDSPASAPVEPTAEGE